MKKYFKIEFENSGNKRKNDFVILRAESEEKSH